MLSPVSIEFDEKARQILDRNLGAVLDRLWLGHGWREIPTRVAYAAAIGDGVAKYLAARRCESCWEVLKMR